MQSDSYLCKTMQNSSFQYGNVTLATDLLFKMSYTPTPDKDIIMCEKTRKQKN